MKNLFWLLCMLTASTQVFAINQTDAANYYQEVTPFLYNEDNFGNLPKGQLEKIESCHEKGNPLCTALLAKYYAAQGYKTKSAADCKKSCLLAQKFFATNFPVINIKVKNIYGRAHTNIGYMYILGCGAPEDREQAFKQFKTGYHYGDIKAAYYISGYYDEKAHEVAKSLSSLSFDSSENINKYITYRAKQYAWLKKTLSMENSNHSLPKNIKNSIVLMMHDIANSFGSNKANFLKQADEIYHGI